MSNYQGFEVKDGGILDLVEATCRHLTSGGVFTESSTVRKTDVERFINTSYYWLIGEMARCGYNTTVTLDTVKGALEQIQAVGAAVQVEFAVPTTSTGEENTRYRGLVAWRDRLVKNLLETDALQQLGAQRDRIPSTNLEGTGRSISRKTSVYGDTDMVPARFPRGFGQPKTTGNISGRDTASGADPSLA